MNAIEYRTLNFVFVYFIVRELGHLIAFCSKSVASESESRRA